MTTVQAHPFDDFHYPHAAVDAGDADLRANIEESGVARLIAEGAELGFVFSAEAFACLQGFIEEMEERWAFAEAELAEERGELIPHEQVVAGTRRLLNGAS